MSTEFSSLTPTQQKLGMEVLRSVKWLQKNRGYSQSKAIAAVKEVFFKSEPVSDDECEMCISTLRMMFTDEDLTSVLHKESQRIINTLLK